MKLVVLDARTLAVITDGELDDDELAFMSERFRDALPDYRVIVFPGPGSVVDLRNDPEAQRLAHELWTRIWEAVPA